MMSTDDIGVESGLDRRPCGHAFGSPFLSFDLVLLFKSNVRLNA